jgi:DNA-binding FadR family transcriptional regulator
VPAAGLAAVRRSDSHLEELRQTLVEPADGTQVEAIGRNKAFHSILMRATGSPLVEVLIQPVFEVIYDHVIEWEAPADFWAKLEHDHDRIFAAIVARDADTAQEATRDHLRKLRPAYN